MALGLMSGTSLDGIDVALLRTDGEALIAAGPWATYPYEAPLREQVRSVLGGPKSDDGNPVAAAERALTLAHAEAVRRFLAEQGRAAAAVDLIGFHGHTILHRPQERRTWQIGDGALLARETGIPVVNDFRSADVAAGGQGAPLVPLYHAALSRALAHPVAVLNIGGVANVTWISADGTVLAFDTGPGNAPLDDWARRHSGAAMDEGGRLAAGGRLDRAVVERALAHPFFARTPPKSLDRDDFTWRLVDGLGPADGAATLVAIVAGAVAKSARHFPAPATRWLVTGGGRHNQVLMAALAGALGIEVAPVEAVGWAGDAIEAQAFAYLAVRARRGLPLSLPSTTGVPRPLTGGRLHPAPGRQVEGR
jgi:anhydro-N-acetylmuramic acid kinase